MDKYEYQLKLDQINKLIERNDYATALKIADNIDWKRVRSVNTLSKVADIYEKNEKYEESRDLLMMAYERAPVGRMIAYRLADLCIRLEDYDQAIEYYKDFVHSAPKDPAKLILKYKIFRGKGAALKDQIAILEEYRAQEYEEQWALELAYLYEEAGEIEKCVNECDELILWFNDGKYVMKAMELKMRYEPLTPAQQEKYELRMNKTKLVDAQDNPNMLNAYQQEQPAPDGYEQQYTEGYPEGYDPAYEQEYAGMNGYEQNADYGQNGEAYYGNGQPYGDDLPKIQDPENLGGDGYQVEADGQMVLQMPDYQPVDRQITGQMTIQEILSEWEKARQPLQEEENAENKEAAPEETTAAAGAVPEKTETPAEKPVQKNTQPQAASTPEPEDRVTGESAGELAPEENAGISEEEELPEIAMPEEPSEISEEDDLPEIAMPEDLEGEPAPVSATEATEDEAPVSEPIEDKTEKEATSEPEDGITEAGFGTSMPKNGVTEDATETPAPEEATAISEEDELPEIAMPEGLEEEPASASATEAPVQAENTTEETVEASAAEAGEDDLPEIAMPEGLEEEPASASTTEATEDEAPVSEPIEDKTEKEATFEPEDSITDVPAETPAPDEATAISKEDDLPEIAMPEGFEDIPASETEAVSPAAESSVPVQEEVQPQADANAYVDLNSHAAPNGYTDPNGYAVPDSYADPNGYAAPDTYADPNAYADPNGYTDSYGNQMYEDDDYYTNPGGSDEDEDAADNLESRIVNSLSSDSLVLADADDGTLDGRIGEERIRRVQRREERRQTSAHGELTEDQKKLFTYFAPVHGMSDQLWMALENEKGYIRGGTSNIGNIMIMGEPGSGKTMLAVNLVKAIQKSRHVSAGKLAKISAETLNEKDVSAIVRKLSGGALIIERASELTNETAIRLEVAMRGQTGELLFIFEDEKQSLKRFMKLHPKLAAMCTTKIDIPIFNNDELVEFGKCYANELEYSIDEMAVLALYNRIGNMQRDDYDVSVTDVKRIVDAAIEKNEKGGVGKFFSLLTKKRYDDDDCIVLREKDFEE
ncbi:hypothetical protein RJD28_01935 [Oscillospiraceae bacterium NTUH-002-81]|nr:hypothetical protein RJD28_01935 [Oscillospiraceae bacterium NTUH-002-81]